MILNGFEQTMLADNPVFMHRVSADPAPICIAMPGIQTGSFSYNKAPNEINKGYLQIPSLGVFGYNGMRFNGMSQKIAAFMPHSTVYDKSYATLAIVMSRMRTTGPVANTPYGSSVFGCIKNRGIGVYSDTTGYVALYLRMNGVWKIIQLNNLLLDVQKNLIHCTFNGSTIIVYLNGVAVSTTDVGGNYVLQYSGAGFAIGADSGGGSIDESTYSDVDVSCVAFYGSPLSSARVAAHYQAWSKVSSISGTARLANGAPAESIIITDTQSLQSAKVAPNTDGTWSAAVPPGSYFVGAMGPAGYRPLAHGPIVAS